MNMRRYLKFWLFTIALYGLDLLADTTVTTTDSEGNTTTTMSQEGEEQSNNTEIVPVPRPWIGPGWYGDAWYGDEASYHADVNRTVNANQYNFNPQDRTNGDADGRREGIQDGRGRLGEGVAGGGAGSRQGGSKKTKRGRRRGDMGDR